MSLKSLSVFVMMVLLVPDVMGREIFTCLGSNGRRVMTDDARHCASNVTSKQIHESKGSGVNYRYPNRLYADKSGTYPVFIEYPESEHLAKQFDLAVKRLNDTLDMLYSKLPHRTHSYLKAISFYIMIGPKAKLGGEKDGLRYFPDNGDNIRLVGDKRWTNAIVIYSVENFLALSDLWTKKVVMHELAHAWHYQDWNKNYPIMKNAWLNSRNQGLYQSQKSIEGKLFEPAYATTNEKEYFAELSAMYFVGCDYFPFNRQDLASYDPKGYQLIEGLWGL